MHQKLRYRSEFTGLHLSFSNLVQELFGFKGPTTAKQIKKKKKMEPPQTVQTFTDDTDLCFWNSLMAWVWAWTRASNLCLWESNMGN